MQFFPNFLQKCCLFFYISYRSETKEIPLSTTGTRSLDDAFVSYDNFVQHKFGYLVVENKTETKRYFRWLHLGMLNIQHMFIFECGLCTWWWLSLVRVVIYGHVYQLSVLTRKCLIAPFVEMGEYFQKSVLQYPEVFSFLQPVHRILHINFLWLLCCWVWSRLLAVPYCNYRKTHVAVALFSRSSKNSMLSLPSKKYFCDYCVTETNVSK